MKLWYGIQGSLFLSWAPSVHGRGRCSVRLRLLRRLLRPRRRGLEEYARVYLQSPREGHDGGEPRFAQAPFDPEHVPPGESGPLGQRRLRVAGRFPEFPQTATKGGERIHEQTVANWPCIVKRDDISSAARQGRRRGRPGRLRRLVQAADGVGPTIQFNRLSSVMQNSPPTVSENSPPLPLRRERKCRRNSYRRHGPSAQRSSHARGVPMVRRERWEELRRLAVERACRIRQF
jgi:hypothetical protein